MWIYEKRLEFPVKITNTNPKIAQVIMSQYGGAYSKKPETKQLETATSSYKP